MDDYDLSDNVSSSSISQAAATYLIDAGYEPFDVVFAGDPTRAYVSCSRENALQVFDLEDPILLPTSLALVGEEPRSLAVGPDGIRVHVAALMVPLEETQPSRVTAPFTMSKANSEQTVIEFSGLTMDPENVKEAATRVPLQWQCWC